MRKYGGKYKSYLNNRLLTEREGRIGEYLSDRGPMFPSTARASSVSVLVTNFEFAGFAPKQKPHGLDRIHGNGPYCKILTEEEPIRAQGFA